jgi:hypothetical protein
MRVATLSSVATSDAVFKRTQPLISKEVGE